MPAALERANLASEAQTAWMEHAERCKKALGGDHPDTLSALTHSATITGSNKDDKSGCAAAVATLRQVVSTKERSANFGKDHKSTYASIVELAKMLEAHGEIKAAMSEYEKLSLAKGVDPKTATECKKELARLKMVKSKKG